MPNIKSQKDRVVQAKKEALHNKAIKSNLTPPFPPAPPTKTLL